MSQVIKSNIKLYSNTILKTDKKYVIEDLETYLAVRYSKSFDIQYRKHDHYLTVIIPYDITLESTKSLSPANLSSDAPRWNYCSIRNYRDDDGNIYYLDAKPIYYFITAVKWGSSTSIILELEMDSLNTYMGDNNLVSFNKRTLITRQHKDRFYRKYGTGATVRLWRTIDRINENINPTLYSTQAKSQLDNSPYYTDTNSYDDWYLVFRDDMLLNVDAGICYLYPEKSKTFYAGLTKLKSDMTTNEIRYYTEFTADIIFSDMMGNTDGPYRGYFAIKQDGKVYKLTPNDSNTGYDSTLLLSDFFQYTVTNLTTLTLVYRYETSTVLHLFYSDIQAMSVASYATERLEQQTLKGINSLDKYNPNISKIICLPYCPIELNGNRIPLEASFSVDPDNEYVINVSNFTYASEIGKVNEFDITDKNLNPLYHTSVVVSAPSLNDSRNKDLESKMYNSEFYYPKFVYDIFGFQFQLEKIDSSKYSSVDPPHFRFDFVSTFVGNTGFIFNFKNYYIDGKSDTDYPNLLSIKRNNEEAVFNNNYLNYVNNGYNFDQKILALQNQQAWMNYGASTANSAINAFKVPTVASISSLIIGASSNALAVINAEKQREIMQEAKLADLAQQATTISNSDGIDLLKYYSKNKAKLVYYQISQQMYDMINDLFHYFGYSDSVYAVPNLDTRKWWNYIECDAVFNPATFYISDEILDDLKQRFKSGVTVFHSQVISSVTTWDFDQEKENWEESIF